MALRVSACSAIIVNSNCNRNKYENDGNDSDKSSKGIQWHTQNFTQIYFLPFPHITLLTGQFQSFAASAVGL